MPVQHSPPARQTRFQAKPPAVLLPTPRAPLDGTSKVSQLAAHLERGPNLKGEIQYRKEGRGPRRSSPFAGVVGACSGMSRTTLKGPGEGFDDEEENSLEEEVSDCI
ncbi:hypothetical protein O181_045973 [Austropuccinia psidii MF-1]|uniref:Uncharacterized protein n=1 Tax=Austropuccinia psidii MF-1 TaxID=1389203 RepID=A0A9Q3HI35_9BASI|nr:hypothetical protein [Austropuccinia psidii MF-1]